MGWSSLSVAMTYIHPSEDRVLNAFSSVGGHNFGHSAKNDIYDEVVGDAASAAVPEGYMVSAAGLEPATHALKERAISDLPRIFNNLQLPRAP
jgi:hypothetical protein